MEENHAIQLKYLGHSTFLFTTPGGNRLLIDPWVSANPACPEADKKIDRLDLMLITHGHFDHIYDAVAWPSATNRRSDASSKLRAGWAAREWKTSVR